MTFALYFVLAVVSLLAVFWFHPRHFMVWASEFNRKGEEIWLNYEINEITGIEQVKKTEQISYLCVITWLLVWPIFLTWLLIKSIAYLLAVMGKNANKRQHMIKASISLREQQLHELNCQIEEAKKELLKI